MTSPYRRLASNTVLFGIATTGRQLAYVSLLPLYTNSLSVSDFGVADLLIVTAQLLLPLMTMSVYEAVFRMVLGKVEDARMVLSQALSVIGLGAITLGALLGSMGAAGLFQPRLLIYLWALVSLQALQTVFAQFTRAMGSIRFYSVDALCMSITLMAATFLLFTRWQASIDSYFLGVLIANTQSVLVLGVRWRRSVSLRYRPLDRRLIAAMLRYSAPLIPNAVMWWLLNSVSRFILLAYLGAGSVGIFAAASRLPNVLTLLSAMIAQSWQISAVEQFGAKGSGRFVEVVLDAYWRSSVLILAALVFVVKPLSDLLLGHDFSAAWIYIPPLGLAVIFANLSTFIGVNYVTSMNTVGALRTSGIAALISLGIGVLSTPWLGIWGIVVAKCVGMAALFAWRVVDTQRIVRFALRWRSMLLWLAIVGVQYGVLHFDLGPRLELELTGGVLVLLGFMSVPTWRRVLNAVLRRPSGGPDAGVH